MRQTELKKLLINCRDIKTIQWNEMQEYKGNSSVKQMIDKEEGYIKALNDIISMINGDSIYFKIGLINYDKKTA